MVKRKETTLLAFLRLINRLTFGVATRLSFSFIPRYIAFWRDFFCYRALPGAGRVSVWKLEPVLSEASATSPVAYHYFYQDTWAAKKIFEAKPKVHVDVASTVLLVGVLSQFTKVISIDIRPLDVHLEGLTTRAGNVSHMPFPDNSVESLSSLCVIEHIGLGRYGDPLNPRGTDEAISEFRRILKPGGNLYVSVPVSDRDEVYFNAHRMFHPEHFIKKFDRLTLQEVKYVQDNAVYGAEDFERLDHTREIFGLFHFEKRA